MSLADTILTGRRRSAAGLHAQFLSVSRRPANTVAWRWSCGRWRIAVRIFVTNGVGSLTPWPSRN